MIAVIRLHSPADDSRPGATAGGTPTICTTPDSKGKLTPDTKSPVMHRSASLALQPAARAAFRQRSLPMNDVSQILSAIGQGDPQAASQLLPLIYDELRKLAALKLARERPGQTLQATALVHEA